MNTWAAYYSPSKHLLYKTDSYHYDLHSTLRADRRERIAQVNSHNIRTFTSSDATPATNVTKHGNTIRAEIGQGILDSGTTLEGLLLEDTFESFIAKQPTWTSDLCSKWTSIQDIGAIAAQLQDPTKLVQIASDGSVKLGVGCYGVVIPGMSGEQLFTNQRKIKNDISPVTIRRTETIGVLSALVIVRCLQEFLGIGNFNHGIIALW